MKGSHSCLHYDLARSCRLVGLPGKGKLWKLLHCRSWWNGSCASPSVPACINLVFSYISISFIGYCVHLWISIYIYIYMFQDLGPWTTHVNPCSMFALNELHNMISRQLADGIAAGRVWMAALQVLGGMTCHDCMSSCRSGGHWLPKVVHALLGEKPATKYKSEKWCSS